MNDLNKKSDINIPSPPSLRGYCNPPYTPGEKKQNLYDGI